eukprot:4130307-Amphidinium_carterae.1
MEFVSNRRRVNSLNISALIPQTPRPTTTKTFPLLLWRVDTDMLGLGEQKNNRSCLSLNGQMVLACTIVDGMISYGDHGS